MSQTQNTTTATASQAPGPIHTRADLETYLVTGDKHRPLTDGTLSGEHYLIRFKDILFGGTYRRKMRLFCIDGTFYPVVCHFDTYWNVRGDNRKEIMATNEALMAEEKRYLADWRSYVGAANADALERLPEVVGLEFFGIDFNFDEDGVFIYELNPTMRHSFDHAKNFPYKMEYDQATSAAFAEMIEKRLAM